MLGERLSCLVPFEGLKLAAAVVILSPYLPLLFMGEEYGEEAPFLYFVSHSAPDLIQAVRNGRREEFVTFNWEGESPDPQSEETFLKSKINWGKGKEGRHKVLLDFYKQLIGLRKKIPALRCLSKENLDAWGLEKERVIFMQRWEKGGKGQVLTIFNLNKADLNLKPFFPKGAWKKVLDSSEQTWNGSGTLLPEKINSMGIGETSRFNSSGARSNDEIIIRGLSMALYQGEEI
jgi:maltooligosyltrehalose trehalohydrolase